MMTELISVPPGTVGFWAPIKNPAGRVIGCEKIILRPNDEGLWVGKGEFMDIVVVAEPWPDDVDEVQEEERKPVKEARKLCGCYRCLAQRFGQLAVKVIHKIYTPRPHAHASGSFFEVEES